jgi:GPH family glycoside/pentoside/hexuronide:cation symporter
VTSEGRLPLGDVISYALPSATVAIVMVSVAMYLPNYYTDELGVTAGLLSWVFLAGRVLDAVTDPLMGFVSDRTHTRLGRRRPYMLVAALPLWIVFVLVWSPASSLSPTGVFVHLLACYLLLYVFMTIFSIPYVALGMELTPSYDDRTRLFGVRQLFMVVGTAAGMLAPFAFAEAMGGKASGYPTMALSLGGIGAVLIVIASVRIRERPRAEVQDQLAFFRGLRVTAANRPFRILLLVYLASHVGGSFIAPLSLFIAKYVIKVEWAMQPVMLAYLAGSMLSIPIWLRLSRAYGKNRTWTIGMLVGVSAYATSYTYHEGTWVLWVVLGAVVGAAGGCTMTLGPAIAADAIDQDELETGRRREGVFMGVWSLIDKAAVGLAVFVGMQGLDLIGYVPNQDQTQGVISGMKFLYCVLPAVLNLAAVVAFQRFPITRELHDRIREQLEVQRKGSVSAEVGG